MRDESALRPAVFPWGTGYRAVLSARFRTLLQYRAAAAAGFGTQLFWGLIRVMIFGAFYASSSQRPPMDFRQMLAYIWLGQAFFAMLPIWADPEIRTMIRTGTVAYELLRPLDLYWLWYTRALAARTAPTLLRSVPMLVVAGLFLGLPPPPSWLAAGAWLLTTAGALLLACALTTLINISYLWTISGEGVSRLLPALTYILSGIMVPIPLFPEWAQAVLYFLPFRGTMDTPFRAYSGHLTPPQVLPALAHQLAWTLAFLLLGRWLLGRATRRLVVQGG